MYDFKTLSSHDFEMLVRDLLQKHFNVFLESFKTGRDKGIDLRYATSKENILIVQCKHYASTGITGLLSALKKETAKVRKLAPNRYIVATSVPLSPTNKDVISGIFSPFCNASEDVFGCDELNNLLSLYQDIERQHFKLWLTSTTVLEQLIHNGLYNQTSILVESIQEKAKYYVQNSSYYDALEVLKEHNYCIISGIPGIGKTFLAEILLLHHIINGYIPVVVRSHIREAFEMLKASTKQVFYFDDFLGQTGWEEKLEKNEDQSIVDFIKYTKTHKHAKFILTTREYILQHARNLYEKLHAPELEHAKCVINLESYTRKDKTHILFNHIYFSTLPEEFKKSIAQTKYLLAIIDHENYSPRIVEWMSDHKNIRDFNANEYPKHFLYTLANPDALWRHAFRKHLSPSFRSVLIVMMTFRFAVDMVDLKEAFISFRHREVELFGGNFSPNDFRSALDELEGSFIRCERDNHTILVAFHNPSVLDFLESYLSENAELLRILCASIIFYDQFLALCLLRGGKNEHEHIANVLGQEQNLISDTIIRSYSRTAKQKKLQKQKNGSIISTSQVQTTVEDNIAHSLKTIRHLPIENQDEVARKLLSDEISRISVGNAPLQHIPEIIECAIHLSSVSNTLDKLIEVAAIQFKKEDNDYQEIEVLDALSEFIKVAPNVLESDFIDNIKRKLDEDSEIIFDWKISDADDESAIAECRSIAWKFEEVFDVNLSHILGWIDEKEEEIKNHFDELPDDWYDRGKGDDTPNIRDSDILDIFDSLDE